MIRKLILCTLLALCAQWAGAYTVVIDAGHGGKDPGAVSQDKKTYEKTLTLDIAKTLADKIKADVKVVYTRKTDVFVELHERARIANKAKADLFISVHTNAMPNKIIRRGTETYTLGMHRAADNLAVAKRENSVITLESDYQQHYEGFDPNSSESYIIFEFMQDQNMASSVEFAKGVQEQFARTAGRVNKGVYQAGFLVLRETSMPSVLIELGYISTPDEEQYLNTAKGQQAMALSIYNAFKNYKNKKQ